MTYPEHDKLKAVRDQTQAAGEFLDWLRSNGFALIQRQNPDWPVQPTDELLAAWQGIDLAELEREKRRMIAAYQEMRPR